MWKPTRVPLIRGRRKRWEKEKPFFFFVFTCKTMTETREGYPKLWIKRREPLRFDRHLLSPKLPNPSDVDVPPCMYVSIYLSTPHLSALYVSPCKVIRSIESPIFFCRMPPSITLGIYIYIYNKN